MPEPDAPTPDTSQAPSGMPAPEAFRVARADTTSAHWSTVERSLASLTRRARRVLTAQRLFVLIAATVGVAVALALLDYALRVPGWLRMLTLPAWLGLLGWSWWTWVRPALRFNPDQTEVALRVERSYPDLKGRLGAAADLARGQAALPTETSRGMAEASVRQTVALWGGRDAASLVRTHALKRAALALGGAAAVCAGLFALSPSGWWIGLQRVVTPWSGAEWPKRTGVADATDAAVHPLGQALALRALLTRSPGGTPDQTDVFVEYRFLGSGAPSGSWRKELLTWQGREGVTDVSALDPLGRRQTTQVSGPLFERLIDPAGEAVQYRLLTRDDETETRTVKLVPPPTLLSAQAALTPPAYAGSPALSVDLGAGTDERASAPPALAGSRVDLKLTLSSAARFDPPLQDQVRLIDGPDTPVALTGAGKEWTLSWTLNKPVRLVVRPVDEHGIAAVEDAVIRFDALEDKPAEATITTPGSDRGVLPTALIDVVAEARDDVGLRWLRLERQLARPAGREGGEKSGPAGALEPVGEPEAIAAEDAAAPARALSARAGVDLAVLGVKPGDEVRLTALAKDVFAVPGAEGEPGERAPTRSAVRTLRVISESQFIEEVQRELTQVRQAAIRIEAQQGEVQTRTAERGADRTARRGQAQVSERIDRQGDAVERVAERVKENGLMDPALAEVLRRAQESIQQAGRASSEAGKTLDEASAGLSEPAPDAAPTQQPAEPLGGAKAQAAQPDQQKVREEMARLAEMLDKGQDSWVVRNKLEQLIKAQEALQEQTKATGEQTAGKTAAELSRQERSDLQSIVDKQTQLAEELSKLTREMREKAEQVSKKDAAAAQGMKDAADRAEQQQVSEEMKSAASSAGQNRMSDAGQRQQQAAKALKQMKQDLDANERRRTLVLMRQLQQIAEALERLVKEQESQLAALDAAQKAQSGYAGLDKGMIALNQNTLAVEEQAGAVQGLEPVAKLIGKAASAQGGAVAALRSAPIDPEPVRELENESLDALKTALERARKMNEDAKDAEERRKLAELKEKYQEHLKEQERLRAEAAGFAEVKELARRDRVLVRRLGESQRTLAAALSTLHEETKELKEAIVFDYAHKRLSETTANAAKALEAADARAALRPQDASILTLKNIIDALTDPKNDSKFAQGQGGGGGGGGQGGQRPGLLPPAKQLRLLRMIQAELAQSTHGAEQQAPEAPDADAIARQQRDIAQLGADLLKKLSSGTGGEQPAIPFGPAPKPLDPPPQPPQPAPPENLPEPPAENPEPAPGFGEQTQEQRDAA